MELKDYYFILGVPRTATERDILRAFRDLAKLYHPDRVGQQGTASFQDIVEAYEILSDPERRRHYNHSLSEYVDVIPSAPSVGSARAQPEPLVPESRRYRLYNRPEALVSEPMSILHDFGLMRPSFEALRDHFLQNFTGRGRPKAGGVASLTADIRLSPYEALQGVMVPVGIPVFVRCTGCGGSGRDWFSPCPSCRGQGLVETERTVNVRIPAQVRAGDVFEVPLRGFGIHNLFLRLHIRIAW
jgi:curved DNA-binding protein CbpA